MSINLRRQCLRLGSLLGEASSPPFGFGSSDADTAEACERQDGDQDKEDNRDDAIYRKFGAGDVG